MRSKTFALRQWGKKGFRVTSGLFSDLFWGFEDYLIIIIFTKVLKGLIHDVTQFVTRGCINHHVEIKRMISSSLGAKQDMVPPPRTGADKVKPRLEGLSRGSPTRPWEGLHQNTHGGSVRRLERKIIKLMLLFN